MATEPGRQVYFVLASAALGAVVAGFLLRRRSHRPKSTAPTESADDVVRPADAPGELLAKRALVAGMEGARALKAWKSYEEFQVAPGHKCGQCWLMRQHCCCSGVEQVSLRPRVIVVMHYAELGRHLGSNTAKLLLQFGAELYAWGVEAQDEKLRRLLAEDPAGSCVLFPSPGALEAQEVTKRLGFPRRIIVLDGGWRECKRMNEWIDPEIARCVVTTARRSEFGGTRKYGGTSAEADQSRVQTAAAFVMLMQELGEEATQVASMKDSLAHFMECWEAQIRRSKTWVT